MILYGSWENFWPNVLGPYIPNGSAALYCPEAPENIGYPAIPNTSPHVGTAFHAWAHISWGTPSEHNLWGENWESSYGVNGWLSAQRAGDPIPLPPNTSADYYWTLPAAEPDKIPVFGDCIIVGGAPLHSDPPPRNLITPLPTTGNPNGGGHAGMFSFCIARHGRAINVVFLDGHARRVPLEELWRLKWNRYFQPTSVTLPPE